MSPPPAMDAALLDRLRRDSPRLILVLGASDTGKTTLIEQLARDWSPQEPLALVDCDVGQSRLGPPTTIGWGVVEPPYRGWHRVTLRGIAFTGSLSPESNLETFLNAAARVIDAARACGHRLVVDTTGLIDGEPGQTLKTRKIALMKPELILALQRERELESILAACHGMSVERLAPSPACVRRSLAQRTAYRNQQFARYFAMSSLVRLPLRHVRLIGLGPEWPSGRVSVSPAALLDRVVGLRNAQGDDLALGLVREYVHEQTSLLALTPLTNVADIATLAVGSLRWPAEGAA